MTKMARALVTLAVVAVAAIGALWWCRDGAAVPALPPDTPAATAPPSSMAADAQTVLRGAAPLPKDETASRVELAPPTGDEAELFGRCVDVDGKPLAGVHVALSGRVANDARLLEYLRTGEAKPEPMALPPQVTGADGTFSFRFVPPPPFEIDVALEAEGCARQRGSWLTIAKGARIDCGDVTMMAGIAVHGTVVDASGAPVMGATTTWLQQGHPYGKVMPKNVSNSPASDGAGRFTVDDRLGPGRWQVSITAKDAWRPNVVVEVAPQPAEQSFHFALPSKQPTVSITGVVEDERGAPIADARLESPDAVGGWGHSDPDGRFRFEQQKRYATQPVHLRALADGYEVATTDDAIAWGGTDVRIVLRRALDLEVAAVDAATGEPIEAFGVRLVPAPEKFLRVVGDFSKLLQLGDHPGGVVTIAGIQRGAWDLRVEPVGDRYTSPAFRRIIVADGAPRRHTFELSRAVSRTVRVERAGGPVAGSHVELLMPLGGPVQLATKAVMFAAGRSFGGAVECEGTTSAAGTFLVSGDPGSRYTLRVTGDRHRPVILSDVALGDQPEPWVIEVEAGATIHGRLRPATLVAQVRAEVGLPARGAVSADDRWRLPSIQLARETDDGEELFPPARGLPLTADDGTFTLGGIAPGTWHLQLIAPRAGGIPGFPSITWSTVPLVDVVGLRDGEERDVSIDVSHLLHATLKGEVLRDGEPWSGFASLERIEAGAPGARWPLTLPAGGHFEATVQAGTIRLLVPASGLPGDAMVPAEETVAVAPGATTIATFHVRLRPVTLRLHTGDDTPAEGVRVALVRSSDGYVIPFPATDANGTCSAVAVEGAFVARALVRGAQAAPQHPATWTGEGVVDLGAVPITATTAALSLRLPDAAGW